MTNAFYVALTFKLRTMGSLDRAESDKARYESAWDHLGVSDEDLNKAVKNVVGTADTDVLLPFAERLWNEPVWEFKVAGLRALALEHVDASDDLWKFVLACVGQLDGLGFSDNLAPVAEKCLLADQARFDDVEKWAASRHKWTRRAAVAFTLPKAVADAASSRISAWAESLKDDKEAVVKDAATAWLAANGG